MVFVCIGLPIPTARGTKRDKKTVAEATVFCLDLKFKAARMILRAGSGFAQNGCRNLLPEAQSAIKRPSRKQRSFVLT